MHFSSYTNIESISIECFFSTSQRCKNGKFHVFVQGNDEKIGVTCVKAAKMNGLLHVIDSECAYLL